jgi:hypothetical protein
MSSVPPPNRAVPPPPRAHPKPAWYQRRRALSPIGLLAFLLVASGCGEAPDTSQQAAPTASTAVVTTTELTATTVTPTPTGASATTKAPTTTRRIVAAAPPTTKRRPPATTRSQRTCDPSYPDACLRVGIGDYDCAGGSGNGPNYVEGPIRVVQPDPFDLDRDGDGVGCES